MADIPNKKDLKDILNRQKKKIKGLVDTVSKEFSEKTKEEVKKEADDALMKRNMYGLTCGVVAYSALSDLKRGKLVFATYKGFAAAGLAALTAEKQKKYNKLMSKLY